MTEKNSNIQKKFKNSNKKNRKKMTEKNSNIQKKLKNSNKKK